MQCGVPYRRKERRTGFDHGRVIAGIRDPYHFGYVGDQAQCRDRLLVRTVELLDADKEGTRLSTEESSATIKCEYVNLPTRRPQQR
jgi:hypothetical protein